MSQRARSGLVGREDSLLRWIVGVAIGLAAAHVALAFIWGPAPVIAVLPWYVPMVFSWAALAAFGIAFLALGRYRVLREPPPFWIGVGFAAFGVLSVFYVLSWPGLLPGERGVIAQLPNTAAGLFNIEFSALAASLLAATLIPWPRTGARGERFWPWLAAAAMAASVTLAGLSLLLEQSAPILVVDGAWTPLQFAWLYTLLAAFSAGALLSAHRYRQTGDSLLGYVAITQTVLAFFMVSGIVGGERYDLWWYWEQILLAGGFSVMLFGLLSDYVDLYQMERVRARELETLQRVTDPGLARQGLEQLLESLLEQIVAAMGASSGAILLLDPARRELVLRKGLGIPEEQAVGLRVRMGEDFDGRVAAQGETLSVPDAQEDPSIWSPYIAAGHIRGLIGAPMCVGGQTIGVLHLGFLEPRRFTAHEERLLQVVAERAALAIHQASLLEETQEERNRLQVLIDTTPAGIVFFSAPDGKLTLYNKAAEAILGKPLILGRADTEQPAFSRLRHPTGEPIPPEELPSSRSLRGESCVGVELLVLHPSGRRLSVLANCSPLRDARGRVAGAVVALQDITPLREQERLRDEFIATVAHELKTPVTTIKGYAQLMNEWAPGGHDPREGKAVQVISAQADRINRRVQEMLEVVRFRTVPPELHRVRFDLGKLAAQVVQQMQSKTSIHPLVMQQAEPAPVEADLEHVEEVLVTLLDNAIKYSPKGGRIDVRVWTQNGCAVVSVRDYGVGIPKERQAHIFEPFYEAVPAGLPGYRSVVALSLYLAKLIVERHKGRIWFESEPGKGSTFYFTLPLAKEGGDGRQG